MIIEHMAGSEHGSVYKAAQYLVEHVPGWLETAQDPQTLAIGGAGIAAAVVASYVGLRAGEVGIARVKAALDPEPGVVSVGYREDDRILARWTKSFVDLPFWVRCMGSQIVGPTRQGKTTLMEPWAVQDLQHGHTVVIIQTGGDFGKKMLDYADRERFPIRYLNPLDPTAMKWNVLAGDPELVAERAAATLESVSVSNNVYYEAMNSAIMRNMVHAVHAWARIHGTIPTMAKIKRWLVAEQEMREDLEVEEVEGQVTVELKGLKADVSDWFAHQYFAWRPDDRHKNVSSLYLLLDQWIGGEKMKKSLTPEKGEEVLSITEAVQKPGLVLVDIPAETLGPKPSQTTALWALQDLMFSTVNRPNNRPVSVYLDEVHTLLGKENSTAAGKFVDWITGVGKYGVAVHVAYQSFSLLPPLLDSVLESNATNKFILGRLGHKDAEIAQRMLGFQKQVVKETRTVTAKDGSTSTSVAERESERPRWSVWEIRELERGKCFYLGVEVRRRKRMWLAKPIVIQALPAPSA